MENPPPLTLPKMNHNTDLHTNVSQQTKNRQMNDLPRQLMMVCSYVERSGKKVNFLYDVFCSYVERSGKKLNFLNNVYCSYVEILQNLCFVQLIFLYLSSMEGSII